MLARNQTIRYFLIFVAPGLVLDFVRFFVSQALILASALHVLETNSLLYLGASRCTMSKSFEFAKNVTKDAASTKLTPQGAHHLKFLNTLWSYVASPEEASMKSAME